MSEPSALSINPANRHVSIDVRNPAFYQDLLSAYAALHAHCPAFFWEEQQQWYFAGYDQVNGLLRDRRFGRQILHVATREELGLSEPKPHLEDFDRLERYSLLELEPPAHTRLRTLVNRAFVSRQIEQLRPEIAALAHSIIDGFEKDGEVELLKTYAEIIDVPTKVVENVKGLARAIEEFADKDLVLIDTAGRSPREIGSLQELANAFNELPNVQKALLLSATTKRSDLAEIAETYKIFHPGCVIFTKLDETQVYGPVFSHMVHCSSPLACLTVGQNVPKDLVVPDASYIGALFQGQETSSWTESNISETSANPSNHSSKKTASKRPNTLTQPEVNPNV